MSKGKGREGGKRNTREVDDDDDDDDDDCGGERIF